MSAGPQRSRPVKAVTPDRLPPERGPPPPLPFDVVASKIGVPALRADLVSRTALVNRMRANASASVFSITAPGGYGKTTLLAQWAARDPRAFAWISVDARDNDPLVLVRHVAAALHEIEPLEPRLVEALADPGASIWNAALPRLGSALSSFPAPVAIVLDDAHLLRTRESLDALALLADHLGRGAVLALAGRRPARVAMPVLRAAGRLFELGIDELALTPREARLLLRSAGANVELDEAAALADRCEGWPAALHLEALGRRRDGGLDIRGSDNALAGYFRAEYLGRLRPGALQFLRRTSILDAMCGGLCDAVLDRSGSARELEKIEESNLFLVPLDGKGLWYRYHRLFRDALRRELIAHDPGLVPVLHRRAADWFEAHRDPESALEHARAFGDLDRVARNVATIAMPLYHAGRVETVELWLAYLDERQVLKRHPEVAVRGSWIHSLRGRSVDAERWLAEAEAAVSKAHATRRATQVRSWVAMIRAALCRDGAYQMVADAEVALRDLPRDSHARAAALVTLGVGYTLLGQDGRADRILEVAAEDAERLGAIDTQVIALSERAVIAERLHDARSSQRLSDEAHELIASAGLESYETTAIAVALSARASLRQGRWDDARASLDRARSLGHADGVEPFPWFALQTRIELARGYLALRETAAVRSLLAEIRELLRATPHLGVLVDEATALEREVEWMPERDGRSAGLTPAELRLLPLLATHLSFREIGEQLFVSRNTIKTQAISVYRKLGVASRSEAIECAVRVGLVDGARRPA